MKECEKKLNKKKKEMLKDFIPLSLAKYKKKKIKRSTLHKYKKNPSIIEE